MYELIIIQFYKQIAVTIWNSALSMFEHLYGSRLKYDLENE